ncbi:MAG: GNAT family protein [Pseudomonadota bacterium]
MSIPKEFRTDRLRLRPFRGEDLAWLQAYTLEEAFWTFLPLEPQTRESAAAFLDQRLNDAWGEGEFHCAVENLEAGHLIGTVRITEQAPKHRSGNIGYAINPRFGGHGYMTEAVREILKVGIRELGLHRIWATADVENTASWRLMERVGMEREGLLRQHQLVRGEWRDSYLYSVLSGDT